MSERAVPTGDRGAVTAEFAVLLPVVTLLIAAVLVIATCTSAQMRCADAARAGARSAALGESDTVVVETAERVGGDVVVAVARGGEWVQVEVHRELGPRLPVIGGITVRGEATAWVEP
ncbi:TadE family type IV pilus minor pilin [Cellulomonas sp. NPDC089187]|uniref:TadE family type IV pilus minor pilin n=1 Tax=Cellulomonas sp. NPDC089187 TaxID=3154970 RepID=UPI0034122279